MSNDQSGDPGTNESTDALVELALSEAARGDSDAALLELDRALELDPQHAQAWYTKGCIYSDRRQFALSVDCYENSVKHTSEDRVAIPLFNLGNAYRELGDRLNASTAFLRATEADPTMADAWINLGRELDDGGEHARAIQCYDVALELAPEDVDAHKNRGNSQTALEQFEEAEQSYRSALAIYPLEHQAMIGLAACLRSTEKFDEGIEWIDKSLALAQEPLALIEKTRLLHESKRFEEALALIDQLIERGLEHPGFFVFRGEILGDMQRADQAVAQFDDALAKDPGYSPALFRKAEQLAVLGKVEAAKRTLDQYFEQTDQDDEDLLAAEALRNALSHSTE